MLLLLFRRLAFAADLSPAQVDRSNYLALENQANLHAYYPRPPPRPFGLALGALVTVKLVSLRSGGNAPPPPIPPCEQVFEIFFFF